MLSADDALQQDSARSLIYACMHLKICVYVCIGYIAIIISMIFAIGSITDDFRIFVMCKQNRSTRK